MMSKHGSANARLTKLVLGVWVSLGLVLAPHLSAAPIVPQKGSLAGYVYLPAPAAAPGSGGGGTPAPGDTSQLNTCYLDFPQTFPDITYSYPPGASQASVVLHYTVVGGGGGAGGGNRYRPGAAATEVFQLGASGKAGARNTGSFTFSAGDVLRLIVGGGGGGGTSAGLPASYDGWVYGAGGSGAAGYYGGGGGGGGMSWGRFSDSTQPYANNRGSGGGGGGSSVLLRNGAPVAIGFGGDGGDGANWPNSGGKGGSNVGGAGAFNGAVSGYVTNGTGYSYGGSSGVLSAGGRGGAYGYPQLVGPAGVDIGRDAGGVVDGAYISGNYSVNASNSGGGGGYGSAGGSVASGFYTIPRGVAYGGHIQAGWAYAPTVTVSGGTTPSGYPILLEENARYIAQWLGRGTSSRFVGSNASYETLIATEAFFANSKVVSGSAPWAGMGGRLVGGAGEVLQYGSFSNGTTASKNVLGMGASLPVSFGGSSGAIMLSYQAKSCFL